MMKGPQTHASAEWACAGAVHVLAKRPELRSLFPIADEIDTWVRWSA
jgi:hypothetical protein